MAKILGICGSPRRGGNTEILLDQALEGAACSGALVEKIILNELCLKPCQGCDRCSKALRCYIKDDMRQIYKKIRESDGLVIASPIYFGSLSAQVKIMVDRFQPYWVRKYILKRPVSKKISRKGIFLSVEAGVKRSFFNNAKSIIRIFFVTLDVEYLGGIFCGGLDKAGEIRQRPVMMNRSFDLGTKLAKSLIYE